MIYELSNKYKNEPTWFISPQIVNQSFIQSFDTEIYNDNFRKNPVIQRHHRKYINDKYAPAWKSIEFMTLGNVLKLYQNLKCLDDKRTISKHFGINQTAVFENYMETIRVIRNKCAHGSTLFDLSLCKSIKNGPGGTFPIGEAQRLPATIEIILYMIGTISQNRKNDLLTSLDEIYKTAISKSPDIKWIIESIPKKVTNSVSL
jgi:abortive infection bacteriophage resistance protein